jgi:hypothetical protein
MKERERRGAPPTDFGRDAMPSRSDLLLGQIAVEKGFINKQQLTECLKLQETFEDTETPKHLGLILLEKQYIDEEELELALEMQRHRLNENVDNTDLKLKDLLIGQIAVRQKLTTRNQVDECLREQAKIEELGIFLRLGEILVKKGFISSDQLENILSYQKELQDNFRKDALPEGEGTS